MNALNETDGVLAETVKADEEGQATVVVESSCDEVILIDSIGVANEVDIDASGMTQPDVADDPSVTLAQSSGGEDDDKPKRRGWWQRSSSA